jgi:hypothetical protein
VYDEVDVLLQQLPRYYARRPEALRRLEPPRKRYQAWLAEQKDDLARHRKLRGSDLSRRLVDLAGSPSWPDWLGNPKLASFLREVILERRVFDPGTLTLG